MHALENFLAKILHQDIGKLILRLTLGFLMLFHGYSKILGGIGWLKGLVVKMGLPEFIAYGVYLGEVVAPIFIVVGLFTRLSGAIFAGTMLFAIVSVHLNDLFAINMKFGGLQNESVIFYFLSGLALMFLGAGKYSVDKK